MNSATSTKTSAAPDAQFHPWHVYALLAMVAAAASVWVSTHTEPLALILLSAAALSAGLVALALHHALAGFLDRGGDIAPLDDRKRDVLEREKALVLRCIKELEFDHAMGKVSAPDYADLLSRLRARALVLMQDLESPSPSAVPTASAPKAAVILREPEPCATCGTSNDPDAKFCKSCGKNIVLVLIVLAAALWMPMPARAQQMPNPKDMSGLARPDTTVAVGTMTVRVIRGSFDKNVVGQTVEVTVDGDTRTLTTDASGRVEVLDLKPGSRVKAVAVVDGERLESEEIKMGTSGMRMMLVATDGKAAPAVPAVNGTVVFGPESRIVAEMAMDRLSVYFLMDVLNSSAAPVDTGGPLVLTLPPEARGASLMEDSSKQALVSGARVTMMGPFAPGTTKVRVAFELPYSGGTAQISSKMPAALSQVIVIVGQTGGLGLASPQLTAKRDVTDQGERIFVGTGPALAAGQTLVVDITGLPHHPVWPRYLALALAGGLMMTGIWAAAAGRPRRRAA